MHHLALWQRVADEHRLDRLHVIGRVEVHHRKIFVVEVRMLFRQIAIASDQMVEHVEMGVDVAVERFVHRHEPRSAIAFQRYRGGDLSIDLYASAWRSLGLLAAIVYSVWLWRRGYENGYADGRRDGRQT